MGRQMNNPRSLLDAMDAARPEIAESLRDNAVKAKLALDLRRLRKQFGLTQKDVSKISGLTQPMVSRLESPTGNMPNSLTLLRYIKACGGHLAIADIETSEFPADGFALIGEADLEEEVATA